MTVTVPTSEAQYGYVVGRVIRALGDTTDADDKPDAVAAVGKVTFTPKNSLGRTSDYSAFIVREKLDAPLDAQGNLVRYEGATPAGIALTVGAYRVEFTLNSGSIPGFDIEVTAAHTQAAPLDLVTAAPYVPPSGVTVNTMLVPADAVVGQVLSWSASGLDWVDMAAAAGGVSSVAGRTGAVVLSSADLTDVASLATDAELSSGLATKANTSHTHTSAQVTDFTEAAQDIVGAMVTGAGGTYNDEEGTIILPAGGGGLSLDLTPEWVPIEINIGPDDPMWAYFGWEAFAFVLPASVTVQRKVTLSRPLSDSGRILSTLVVREDAPDTVVVHLAAFGSVASASVTLAPGDYLVMYYSWDAGGSVDVTPLRQMVAALSDAGASYRLSASPDGMLTPVVAGDGLELISAEGLQTVASAPGAHAEGLDTIASGDHSHAEGRSTSATGQGAHAEGYSTTASGMYSHAEGEGAEAWRTAEHAHGSARIQRSRIPAETFSAAASRTLTLPITPARLSWVDVTVTAYTSDFGVAAAWQVRALVVAPSTSSRRLVGTPTVTKLGGDAATDAWTVSASLPNANLAIQCTASSSVTWAAYGEITEGK